MTRSPPASTYDDDFFAWTQEQAVALRRVPAVSADIDLTHVAEEIEDLGKRDLREVSTLLERLVEHLIKIDNFPESPDVRHWRDEVRNFRRSAAKTFSPGMRQLLDLGRIWREGQARAKDKVVDDGLRISVPPVCPFSLDDLLTDDFDLDAALSKVATDRRP